MTSHKECWMYPYYKTRRAIVIPAVSGTLSFVSSALILFIIFRSRVTNNTYHRIMTVFAFWDMVQSFAIALTTLPMPNDVGKFYNYAGPSYGTTATCEIQGFVIYLGMGFTISSTLMLNIYYLCVFRYKTDAKKWRRLELVMWTVFTCCALVLPITGLKMKMINPSPFETYCMAGISYPFYPCGDRPSLSLQRGINRDWVKVFFNSFSSGFLGAVLLLQIVSTILIICTVHALQHAKARQHVILERTGTHEHTTATPSNECIAHQESEKHHEGSSMTKVIAGQASMYIIACFLTWSFTLVSMWKETEVISMCKQIFQPLQGFFNAIIFVYHKMYNVRKSDEFLDFREALYKVLFAPHEVPEVLISSVHIVDTHHTFARLQFRLRFQGDESSFCSNNEPAPPFGKDDDVAACSGAASNDISFASAIGPSSCPPSGSDAGLRFASCDKDAVEEISVLSEISVPLPVTRSS